MAAGIKLDKSQVERAARLYRTSVDAGRALGVGSTSFIRACRRWDIDIPEKRRQVGQVEGAPELKKYRL